MRVSEATPCLLGQSNKAIGHESPIGPCVASHPVDNRQACCFRNDRRRHDSEMKPTGERKRISASHAETKQRARPEEDRSQSRRTRSRSGAECPDKNGWVLSRWGRFFSMGEVFLLTFLFIGLVREADYSAKWISSG